MTKKDFDLIAQTIKKLDLCDANQRVYDRSYIARQFAIALQHTNSRFDIDRFVDACK